LYARSTTAAAAACNVEKNEKRKSEMCARSGVRTRVCNVFVPQTRLLATHNGLKESYSTISHIDCERSIRF
jgi:hypothetical protein